MNVGELIAKGSALFLRKKLSAVQQVFDAAPAGEKAAFQSSVSGAGARSAQAQQLMRKLERGADHASILVHGDSTGNETGEWIYRLGQWLFAMYPAYTVRFRAWNFAGDFYDAPIVIGTGTGTKNIDIWSASCPGKWTNYLMGGRFVNSTLNIVNTAIYPDVSPVVDMFFVNHGHNLYQGESLPLLVCHYLECTEPVLLSHSSCGVIIVGQNPAVSRANLASYLAARDFATFRGFGFADVWSKFISLSQAGYLYGDTVHPSQGTGTAAQPTGTDLMLAAVLEHFVLMPGVVGPQNVSTLATLGDNLLTNGLFANWTSATSPPDGWFATSGVTCAKDGSFGDIDNRNNYVLKMTVVGNGTQPYIYQALSNAGYKFGKGKELFLAVRMYQPAGETSSTSGRISLAFGSGLGNGLYTSAEAIPGGWFWRFARVTGQMSAAYGQVNIYANTDGSAGMGGKILYIDKAILVSGPVPRYAIN